MAKEQAIVDHSSNSPEKVDGGCLPDWELAELPAPPPFQFGRAFRGVLGPGIIALGASIGSGEWLLGPKITVQYGGTLLWIATIAIVLQSILNTESIRYTLYTGEPMFSGFMRCRPGSKFWSIVYLITDLGGIWPAWAMTAATALAAAWLGYLPSDDLLSDQNTVRLFAYLIFFACLLIVTFGGKVYNALEKVQLVAVVIIISYLVVIDLTMVSAQTWWVVIKGFFSFGQLPEPKSAGNNIDWMLIGAFAAYAGSDGLGNVTISNYVRDKGWGMSRLVGAIPSVFGGHQITLSHFGKVFPTTTENLDKFREWWKYNRFEQYGIWGVGCFIGLALPAMMAVEFVDPNAAISSNFSAAALQAEGIAQKSGSQLLWNLTLLCGFWVLFSTQLGNMDSVPRRYADIIWTGWIGENRNIRQTNENNGQIKWIYYAIMVAYVVWGIIAIYVAKPLQMVIISATIGGFQLVVTSLHALYVNRRFLPSEIQPPLWRQFGLFLCAGFYTVFACMTVYYKVLLPYVFS